MTTGKATNAKPDAGNSRVLKKLIAVVVVAVSAPFISRAAYWDWKGLDAGNISYFDDLKCWQKSGTTAFKDSNHNIRSENNNPNWDGTVTFRTQTELTYSLPVSYSDKTVLFVSENDSPDNGVSSSGGLNGGFRIQGSAVVNILSGSYSFDKGVYVQGTLMLGNGRGPVLLKGSVSGYQDKNGTVIVNCATLQASSIKDVTVEVGTGGAVLDTEGGVMEVSSAIGNVAGETGFLLVKGGGSVKFLQAPSIKIFVMPGTSVSAATREVADAILSNGMELVGVSATGSYTVMTCDEPLTEADAASVLCDAAQSFTSAVDGTDGKSIVVSVNGLNPGWYIGPADGNLSDQANWSDGNVPAGGVANIFCAFAARLSRGTSFAPASIKFAKGSARVAITGDAIESLGAIVCENGVENVMENAVTFADKIDVTATSGRVRFMSGATGTGIANHTTFYGKYTITATGNWNPPTGSVLTTGSELNLPDGTYYDHNSRLTIESGATVTVKNTKTDSTGRKFLVNKNSGVFKATNEIFSGTSITDNGNGGGYLESSTGGGVFIANKLRATEVLIPPGVETKTIVGPEGFIHGESGYIRIGNSGSYYFGSYADWPIYCNKRANCTTTLKGMRKIGSSALTTVTFDTTDYYDNTVGRTITAETGIGGSTKAYADAVEVVVQGVGSFVFANTGIDDNDFGGGLTVKDSATVSVNKGARPGKGAVTLEDTSTLQVAASGTVTIGGALTIGKNAALAFNFTDRNTAPTLAIPAASTVPETVNVKISADEGIQPSASRTHTLTSTFDFTGKTVNLVNKPDWVYSVDIVDGNLVLSPKAKGLVISFH